MLTFIPSIVIHLALAQSPSSDDLLESTERALSRGQESQTALADALGRWIRDRPDAPVADRAWAFGQLASARALARDFSGATEAATTALALCPEPGATCAAGRAWARFGLASVAESAAGDVVAAAAALDEELPNLPDGPICAMMVARAAAVRGADAESRGDLPAAGKIIRDALAASETERDDPAVAVARRALWLIAVQSSVSEAEITSTLEAAQAEAGGIPSPDDRAQHLAALQVMAAEHLFAGHQPLHALDHLKAALELTNGVVTRSARAAVRVTIHLDRSDAYVALERWDEALAACDKAEGELGGLDEGRVDDARVAIVSKKVDVLSAAQRWSGLLDLAVSGTTTSTKDERIRGLWTALRARSRGEAWFGLGRWQDLIKGEADLLAATRGIDPALARRQERAILLWTGWAALNEGQPAVARDHAERAHALADLGEEAVILEDALGMLADGDARQPVGPTLDLVIPVALGGRPNQALAQGWTSAVDSRSAEGAVLAWGLTTWANRDATQGEQLLRLCPVREQACAAGRVIAGVTTALRLDPPGAASRIAEAALAAEEIADPAVRAIVSTFVAVQHGKATNFQDVNQRLVAWKNAGRLASRLPHGSSRLLAEVFISQPVLYNLSVADREAEVLSTAAAMRTSLSWGATMDPDAWGEFEAAVDLFERQALINLDRPAEAMEAGARTRAALALLPPADRSGYEATSHYLDGQALRALKRPAEAAEAYRACIDDFRQSHAADPGIHQHAGLMRALSLLEAGQREEARDAALAGLDLPAPSDEAAATMMRAALVIVAARATTVDPLNVVDVGDVLADGGDPTQVPDAVTAQGVTAVAAMTGAWGWGLLSRGESAQAAAVSEAVLEYCPEDLAGCAVGRAWALLVRSRAEAPPEAKSTLQMASRLVTPTGDPQGTLGRILSIELATRLANEADHVGAAAAARGALATLPAGPLHGAQLRDRVRGTLLVARGHGTGTGVSERGTSFELAPYSAGGTAASVEDFLARPGETPLTELAFAWAIWANGVASTRSDDARTVAEAVLDSCPDAERGCTDARAYAYVSLALLESANGSDPTETIRSAQTQITRIADSGGRERAARLRTVIAFTQARRGSLSVPAAITALRDAGSLPPDNHARFAGTICEALLANRIGNGLQEDERTLLEGCEEATHLETDSDFQSYSRALYLLVHIGDALSRGEPSSEAQAEFQRQWLRIQSPAPGRATLRIQLGALLANDALSKSDPRQALTELSRVSVELRTPGVPPGLLFMMDGLHAQALLMDGRASEALGVVTSALKRETADVAPETAVAMIGMGMSAAHASGREATVAQLASRAIKAAEGLPAPVRATVRYEVWAMLAQAAANLHDNAGARANAEAALAELETGLVTGATLADEGLLHIFRSMGLDDDGALGALQAAWSAAAGAESDDKGAGLQAMVALRFGERLASMNRPHDALAWFERSVNAASNVQDAQDRSRRLAEAQAAQMGLLLTLGRRADAVHIATGLDQHLSALPSGYQRGHDRVAAALLLGVADSADSGIRDTHLLSLEAALAEGTAPPVDALDAWFAATGPRRVPDVVLASALLASALTAAGNHEEAGGILDAIDEGCAADTLACAEASVWVALTQARVTAARRTGPSAKAALERAQRFADAMGPGTRRDQARFVAAVELSIWKEAHHDNLGALTALEPALGIHAPSSGQAANLRLRHARLAAPNRPPDSDMEALEGRLAADFLNNAGEFSPADRALLAADHDGLEDEAFAQVMEALADLWDGTSPQEVRDRITAVREGCPAELSACRQVRVWSQVVTALADQQETGRMSPAPVRAAFDEARMLDGPEARARWVPLTTILALNHGGTTLSAEETKGTCELTAGLPRGSERRELAGYCYYFRALADANRNDGPAALRDLRAMPGGFRTLPPELVAPARLVPAWAHAQAGHAARARHQAQKATRREPELDADRQALTNHVGAWLARSEIEYAQRRPSAVLSATHALELSEQPGYAASDDLRTHALRDVLVAALRFGDDELADLTAYHLEAMHPTGDVDQALIRLGKWVARLPRNDGPANDPQLEGLLIPVLLGTSLTDEALQEAFTKLSQASRDLSDVARIESLRATLWTSDGRADAGALADLLVSLPHRERLGSAPAWAELALVLATRQTPDKSTAHLRALQAQIAGLPEGDERTILRVYESLAQAMSADRAGTQERLIRGAMATATEVQNPSLKAALSAKLGADLAEFLKNQRRSAEAAEVADAIPAQIVGLGPKAAVFSVGARLLAADAWLSAVRAAEARRDAVDALHRLDALPSTIETNTLRVNALSTLADSALALGRWSEAREAALSGIAGASPDPTSAPAVQAHDMDRRAALAELYRAATVASLRLGLRPEATEAADQAAKLAEALPPTPQRASLLFSIYMSQLSTLPKESSRIEILEKVRVELARFEEVGGLSTDDSKEVDAGLALAYLDGDRPKDAAPLLRRLATNAPPSADYAGLSPWLDAMYRWTPDNEMDSRRRRGAFLTGLEAADELCRRQYGPAAKTCREREMEGVTAAMDGFSVTPAQGLALLLRAEGARTPSTWYETNPAAAECLTALTSSISAGFYGSSVLPGMPAECQSLDLPANPLGAALQLQSEGGLAQGPATPAVSEVGRALGEGVLLRYLRYSKLGVEHYGVFRLDRVGVNWMDLGPAADIDRQMEHLHRMWSEVDEHLRPTHPESEWSAEAKALQRTLLGAIDGTTGDVYLVPDSHLQELPFGALIDADGRAVVARVTFHYLPTAVTLAQRRDHTVGSSLIALAQPDFTHRPPQALVTDSAAASDTDGWVENLAEERGILLIDPTSVRAIIAGSELRYSDDEARRVRDVFQSTEQGTPGYIRARTPASTRYARASMEPGTSTLATHGFVMDHAAILGRELVSEVPSMVLYRAWDVPELVSGVALAGFSATGGSEGTSLADGRGPRPDPLDDGLLTAAEVATLDLRAVRLVTLSACETGRGVNSGHDLVGFRTAFLDAGADNIVMPLWKVSDQHTAELLSGFGAHTSGHAFYPLLWSRDITRDPATALADAQRFWLSEHHGIENHPYYWAAFIALGSDPQHP